MNSPVTLRNRPRPGWSEAAVSSRARTPTSPTPTPTPTRVAYIVNGFPYQTETFVYRELLALRARGCTILPFSIRSTDVSTLSDEALPLVDDTYSILPAPLFDLLKAHLTWLLRSPVVYLATLFFTVTGTHIKLSDRLRSLAHWVEAVSIVPVLERAEVDHLHAHFAVGSATCAQIAARFLDLPWSFTAHAYDIWLDKLLLPEKLRDASFVLTCSEVNRTHLSESYGVSPNKIHTIYHGIDIEHFCPGPEKTDPGAKPVILCVGRLVEQKGIPYLIEACSFLAQEGHEFELVIAGDGPLRGTLENLCRESGIDERTRFVGHVFQQELLEYYKNCDLFVLPCVEANNGDRDGVPNVLIEAMACGACVVSTDFSGVPELVEDGKSGVLVSPADAPALAKAVASLIGDASTRHEMSRAGREAVVTRFAIDVSARSLLGVTGWDRPSEKSLE